VDAVGRTLAGAKPKWYRYGNSKQLFTAGDAPNAVLVEDCASASCVSHLMTGVAMLGTSLLKEHIVQLKKFDTVYVALDKDATKLGLKTVQTLKPHLNVRMLILEDDLKNMEKERLNEFIRRKTD
jgi:DNA primase